MDSKIENLIKKGTKEYDSLPEGMFIKGFFKMSNIPNDVLYALNSKWQELCTTRPDQIPCIIDNKEGDISVFKDDSFVEIHIHAVKMKVIAHKGSDMFNDIMIFFSEFNIVKTEPQQSSDVYVKHVDDRELYEAVNSIVNYCHAHFNNPDGCSRCALSLGQKHNCFMELESKPKDWIIHEPIYSVFR